MISASLFLADPLTWIAAYFVLCLVVFIVLLFGDQPLFKNTPVHWCHILCVDVAGTRLWRCTEWACGKRYAQLLCTEHSPLVQVLYIALVIGGTTLYWSAIHPYLPVPFAPAYHKIIAPVCPLLLIIAFWNACFSDPGYITPSNHAHYLAMYEHDGVLWAPKQCTECQWQRPARARHCDVCGRCVARHDHHCVWINNCVGTMTVAAFIVGSLKQHGVLHRMVWDPAAARPVPITHKPWLLVYTAIQEHQTAAALLLLLFAGGMVLLCFTVQHAWLVCRNITTYEIAKWRHLKALVHALQQRDYDEHTNSISTQSTLLSSDNHAGDDTQQTFQVLAVPQQRVSMRRGWRRVVYTGTQFILPPNPYDCGWWTNVQEVWMGRPMGRGGRKHD